ncbi:MAG: hypothetical protein O6940_14135 [Ignavibacteria bacterium]|nr:hypothetical protein [Ignavibacteria bacterium]
MISDITIDTNVLMHANNSQIEHRVSSIQTINAMLDSETMLCVDEGFSSIESKNRSSIGSEYLNNLQHGMLGFALITHLVNDERIKIVSKKTGTSVLRYINQKVINKKDRIFIRVTYNSDEKVLVSHDFEHFHENNRQSFNRDYNIKILIAKDVIGMF